MVKQFDIYEPKFKILNSETGKEYLAKYVHPGGYLIVGSIKDNVYLPEPRIVSLKREKEDV